MYLIPLRLGQMPMVLRPIMAGYMLTVMYEEVGLQMGFNMWEVDPVEEQRNG